MSFIRVTNIDGSVKTDLNVNKIIGFSQKKAGTEVVMTDNMTYVVHETARQVRNFIKKAQGLLPEKAEHATSEEG